jgi:hypothetical protein
MRCHGTEPDCPIQKNINFGFSPWLVMDVDSVLGVLYSVVVGDDTVVSEAHAASIFRVEVCSEDGSSMYLGRYHRPQMHGVITSRQYVVGDCVSFKRSRVRF